MINKFFSKDFHKYLRLVINMKLAFTNVAFRHNLLCVIQKWIAFKRVITFRLAYISQIHF